MVICYSSPRKLIYPIILFRQHSVKGKTIGIENTSVLPRGRGQGKRMTTKEHK